MNNKILNYLRNKVSHNKKWLKAMEDYFLYKSINEKASKLQYSGREQIGNRSAKKLIIRLLMFRPRTYN